MAKHWTETDIEREGDRLLEAVRRSPAYSADLPPEVTIALLDHIVAVLNDEARCMRQEHGID